MVIVKRQELRTKNLNLFHQRSHIVSSILTRVILPTRDNYQHPYHGICGEMSRCYHASPGQQVLELVVALYSPGTCSASNANVYKIYIDNTITEKGIQS